MQKAEKGRTWIWFKKGAQTVRDRRAWREGKKAKEKLQCVIFIGLMNVNICSYVLCLWAIISLLLIR